MGGIGSGTWIRCDAKDTVDDSLSLDVNYLARGGALLPWYQGVITWRGVSSGHKHASIGFCVRPTPLGDLVLICNYRVGGTAVSVSIDLQTTRPNYGGCRLWFTCPLIDRGIPCRRRVGKLHLPPGAKYFGCRQCYDLTYRSCQESHRDKGRLARLFGA